MRQRYDLLAFSMLLLACVLAAWTAIGGAILSDVQASGFYKELKDWPTLIAAIIAFGTAYIAVLPVCRQVKETQRQAAGAAIAPLTNTAETLEDERRVAFDARQAMSGVPSVVYAYEEGDYHEIYQTWPEKLHAVRAKVDSYREKLQKHVDRHPNIGREIDNLRHMSVKYLKELSDDLGVMGYAFAQQTSGLSYEDGMKTSVMTFSSQLVSGLLTGRTDSSNLPGNLRSL